MLEGIVSSHALLDFNPWGFLADIFDLPDPNMTPLQQADGLFSAWFSARIGAFRFWMKFVFEKNQNGHTDLLSGKSR